MEEAKLRKRQQMNDQSIHQMSRQFPNNSFVGDNKRDPIIEAEINKKVEEQKKVLKQDYDNSIKEIDKNFELRKQEIIEKGNKEREDQRLKWQKYQYEEERKIKQLSEKEADSKL